MTEPKSAPLIGPTLPGASEVAAYLREHPDFLDQNPDLLQLLIPPEQRRGNGVVDMQRYMLDRLRGDMGRMQQTHQDLLVVSRANHSVQGRVHTALLAMLSATTLEHLIEIVTTDLGVHLEVDSAVLGFEALDRLSPQRNSTNLKLLPKGAVDRLMAGAREVLLIADQPGEAEIFGGAATLVRSQALLRLHLRREAPMGILALGARMPDKFHPGQGTELLSFLARAVELLIRGWLDRS